MSRILLNEEDFKSLIAGEIVKKDNVEIALQDIGFHRMESALNDCTLKLMDK